MTLNDLYNPVFKVTPCYELNISQKAKDTAIVATKGEKESVPKL